MILLGLGANLPSTAGPPLATLEAALARLQSAGVEPAALSHWYRTAPVPASDQPWFINAVARVETRLDPPALLAVLQEIERGFGRRRTTPNDARTLDLDILDYDGQILRTAGLILPHPRLHQRAFVLLPLKDVASDWRHPVLGESVSMLIARLPADQIALPFEP
ncbi:MAG TPA: 2-amino-4-hydroxy-6-hydroxymethyldihydropteridine diphosphokinase [Stellaceae bacterium]|nr:2-amino-4-hydroxy-6-hydroxymethyldihydropteridine diphosphokinase [Stellaceae bacterium]